MFSKQDKCGSSAQPLGHIKPVQDLSNEQDPQKPQQAVVEGETNEASLHVLREGESRTGTSDHAVLFVHAPSVPAQQAPGPGLLGSPPTGKSGPVSPSLGHPTLGHPSLALPLPLPQPEVPPT